MFRISRVFLPVILLTALAAASHAESSLEDLERQGRRRLSAQARVDLAPDGSPQFRGMDGLEQGGRVPNYLRALGSLPRAAPEFARLFKTTLYGGAVAPEVKMAIGLRIAQIHGSPYAAIHLQRLLRASSAGRELLRISRGGGFDSLADPERLALRYADSLTRDIHGVSDGDFRAMRAVYNDSQVVEITLTTCFFNYFTRFVEGVRLPLEPWAFEEPFSPPGSSVLPPTARVTLLSDEIIDATQAMAAVSRDPQPRSAGLGLGVANSMRAMMLSPNLGQAWRSYWRSVRESGELTREIMLHVSFAVSMANGCRYCTLHQVQGLRRLDVSPAKLMQMKKDDTALTRRELTAVVFARKLTREPASVTDEDYSKLRAEFGEQGALEIVLQTSAFAFMNRFTDGLHLPSEDEAIRVYREVYGSDWK
jgi:AhpD family alkylhydroperoxidase